MSQYPMNFSVEASAPSGVQTKWTAKAESHPPITSSIPKEFQGLGDGYSPEDLVSIAVLNCIIATYKVIAQMTGLTFEKIEGTVTLTIDRIEKKPPAITKLQGAFKVYKPSDPARAQKIFEDTKRNCMVSNIISIEKTFSLEIL